MLGEYRELLAGVPMPSREQIEAFARFVSTAHSWYKHLPIWPPGVPMNFFLDPGAGAQRIVDARGRVDQVDRLERGFHHSWLPTAKYRDSFGHAAYARTAGTGTVVSFIGADGSQLAPSHEEPLVFEPSGAELVALPDEVLEAGTALLSAVVHPRGPLLVPSRVAWDRDPGRSGTSPADWPAESGGTAALAQILERAEALLADPQLEKPAPDGNPDRHHLLGCDFVLYQLLTPERERQQRGMVAALECVVDLVR